MEHKSGCARTPGLCNAKVAGYTIRFNVSGRSRIGVNSCSCTERQLVRANVQYPGSSRRECKRPGDRGVAVESYSLSRGGSIKIKNSEAPVRTGYGITKSGCRENRQRSGAYLGTVVRYIFS